MWCWTWDKWTSTSLAEEYYQEILSGLDYGAMLLKVHVLKNVVSFALGNDSNIAGLKISWNTKPRVGKLHVRTRVVVVKANASLPVHSNSMAYKYQVHSTA